MKKVIDGKIYNTETADLVCQWDNGYNPNDFNYCSEDLYRTKKGSWFIHGDGGAMSKYSVSSGSNSWGGSSQIEAFSDDEAFEWLQEHNFAEEIEKHFSERVEEA